MSSPTQPPSSAKGTWGINLAIPGALDEGKDADVLNAVQQMLPQFVESLQKIQGVSAVGVDASIKRAMP